MLRHLTAVILSAVIGSTIGTLIWVIWERSTGAPDPLRLVAGFALFTTMFTIPGAILLMYLAFALADRRVKLPVLCLLVLALGTVAGASMLAWVAPAMTAVGALYGFTTAAAFVVTLGLLRAFPSRAS